MKENVMCYRSFSPGQPCDYCHTHKTRQIYYQPEPNFWMVMVCILKDIINETFIIFKLV